MDLSTNTITLARIFYSISVNYGSKQNVADIKFILSTIVMCAIKIITKIDKCLLICSSILITDVHKMLNNSGI